MQKTSYFLAILCIFICTNLIAGLSLSSVTTLPAPTYFDAADKDIIDSVLKLPVYRDLEDSNQYHYVAPFRLFAYEQGLAMLINIPKSDNVYKAEKRIDNLQEIPVVSFEDYPTVIYRRKQIADEKQRKESLIEEFTRQSYAAIQRAEARIERARERIATLEEELSKTISQGNHELIESLKKMIGNLQQEIQLQEAAIKDENSQLEQKVNEEDPRINMLEKELSDVIDELTREYMVDRLNPVLVPIASAGIAIDTSRFATIDAIKIAAKEAIERLKRTHGGFLTLDLYTGFTEKELRDLSFYKNKYMPNLRVSLLNAEDLQFVPLTYLQSRNGEMEASFMFHDIAGEGGYHGATINFDLTVDGAYSLLHNLSPFVLPVGIRAKIAYQMIPFKANLTCDFANGFTLKGRTDVRDGMIIYDNDITQQIRVSDLDTGACKIDMISGDRNSAILTSLHVLKEKLESINMRQTQLSAIESQRYYTGMLLDIDSNGHNPKDDYSWLNYAVIFGSPAVAAGVLSRATEFHWHTNVQDVEKIKTLNFSTEISLNRYQENYASIPTNLCIYYNPLKSGYDRCTNAQESQTNTYIEARKYAENSPVCLGSQTALECGRKRAAEAEDLWPTRGSRMSNNLAAGTPNIFGNY